MAHIVLKPGDPVHYATGVAGDLSARLIRPVLVNADNGLGDRVHAEITLTMRAPYKGWKPGETLRLNPEAVHPRTGWHRSGPTRRYHVSGWCFDWDACTACGRDATPVTDRAAATGV
jgi:hypothetical protein